MKMVEKSEMLMNALKRSKQVNDMLMVREEEELKKIEDMAISLLEEENKAHSLLPEQHVVVPCGEYERRVVECYMKYPEEPRKCKDEVEAYAMCSRNALHCT